MPAERRRGPASTGPRPPRGSATATPTDPLPAGNRNPLPTVRPASSYAPYTVDRPATPRGPHSPYQPPHRPPYTQQPYPLPQSTGAYGRTSPYVPTTYAPAVRPSPHAAASSSRVASQSAVPPWRPEPPHASSSRWQPVPPGYTGTPVPPRTALAPPALPLSAASARATGRRTIASAPGHSRSSPVLVEDSDPASPAADSSTSSGGSCYQPPSQSSGDIPITDAVPEGGSPPPPSSDGIETLPSAASDVGEDFATIVELGQPAPTPRITGPPYACPVAGCPRTYRTYNGVRGHHITHGPFLFACSRCEYKSHTRHLMVRHTRACNKLAEVQAPAEDDPMTAPAVVEAGPSSGAQAPRAFGLGQARGAGDPSVERRPARKHHVPRKKGTPATSGGVPISTSVDDDIMPLRAPSRVPKTAGPPFNCPAPGCTHVLQTKDGLRLHYQTHFGPLFRCRLCNRDFHQRGSARTHVWSVHKDRVALPRKKQVASTLWFKDDDEGPYQCPHCDEDFITRAGAHNHIATHYQPDQCCPFCGFRDFSTRAVHVHMRTCTKRPGNPEERQGWQPGRALSERMGIAGPSRPTARTERDEDDQDDSDEAADSDAAPARPTVATLRATAAAPLAGLDVNTARDPRAVPDFELAKPPPAEWWATDTAPGLWNRSEAAVMLARLAKEAGLVAPETPIPARPNTVPPFPVFDPQSRPAVESRLRPDAWEHALEGYPDPVFVRNILGMIEHGAKLGYEGPLRGTDRPCKANHVMDDDALEAVRSSVKASCSAGYTRMRLPGEAVVYSPVGAVPKKPAGWRMINDLSWPRPSDRQPTTSVNQDIQMPKKWLNYQSVDALFEDLAAEHAARDGSIASKMDRLNGVERDDDVWLWKVDLKDAYRHIAVDENDARLLGFRLDGKDYVDCCLNFGGKSSPFVFNMFTEALQWILASFGVKNPRHLLDDFFGLCRPKTGPPILRFIDALCGYLGLRVAHHKSVTGRCVEILGIMVDGPTATAWLSPDKLKRLRIAVKETLKARTSSYKEAESLVGSLGDAAHVCTVGRAFVRGFYDWLADHRHVNRRTEISLSRDLLDDLRWWDNILRGWPAVALLRLPTSSEQIWTDAATTGGLGGHMGSPKNIKAQFSVPVPKAMVGADIMVLEAEALRHALQLWGPSMEGYEVVCCVDNQAVAEALLSGRIRHRQTQRVIRSIFTLLHEHRLSLRALWISSESNAVADALSRQVFEVPEILGMM